MLYLNLLFITVIVCFIVNISGAMESIKRMVWRMLRDCDYKDFNFRPFDCDLCMTFWVGIIYLICTSHLTLFNILIVCLFAYLSTTITSLLYLVKDCINKVLVMINNRL